MTLTWVSSQFQYGSNAMSGYSDYHWNLSAIQKPVFGGRSLECDSTLNTSVGHVGEFTVSIWKQCIEQLQR